MSRLRVLVEGLGASSYWPSVDRGRSAHLGIDRSVEPADSETATVVRLADPHPDWRRSRTVRDEAAGTGALAIGHPDFAGEADSNGDAG